TRCLSDWSSDVCSSDLRNKKRMTEPNNAHIPEEVIRSEQKRATPIRPGGPEVMGLPGLPPDILDVAVKYGPMLVLAAGAFGAFRSEERRVGNGCVYVEG